jgi:hypothetical protein
MGTKQPDNEALFLSTGLECVIGRGRFAVPLDAVVKLMELEIGPPPPLASPWVGGVAFSDNQLIMSVALARLTASKVFERRMAKWVHLSVNGVTTNWALEVTSVANVVKAEVQNRSVLIGQTRLPSWVSAATLLDGRSLGWIHVPAMLQDLAGSD